MRLAQDSPILAESEDANIASIAVRKDPAQSARRGGWGSSGGALRLVAGLGRGPRLPLNYQYRHCSRPIRLERRDGASTEPRRVAGRAFF